MRARRREREAAAGRGGGLLPVARRERAQGRAFFLGERRGLGSRNDGDAPGPGGRCALRGVWPSEPAPGRRQTDRAAAGGEQTPPRPTASAPSAPSSSSMAYLAGLAPRAADSGGVLHGFLKLGAERGDVKKGKGRVRRGGQEGLHSRVPFAVADTHTRHPPSPMPPPGAVAVLASALLFLVAGWAALRRKQKEREKARLHSQPGAAPPFHHSPGRGPACRRHARPHTHTLSVSQTAPSWKPPTRTGPPPRPPWSPPSRRPPCSRPRARPRWRGRCGRPAPPRTKSEIDERVWRVATRARALPLTALSFPPPPHTAPSPRSLFAPTSWPPPTGATRPGRGWPWPTCRQLAPSLPAWQPWRRGGG